MKSCVLLRISVFSALILSATTAPPASGQTQPISSDSVVYDVNSSPPISSATSHNEKPAVMVMGFESGTVTAQV